MIIIWAHGNPMAYLSTDISTEGLKTFWDKEGEATIQYVEAKNEGLDIKKWIVG